MGITENPGILTNSAKAAFEKKNYSEAARIFLQVVQNIDPDQHPVEHAEARNNLSVALLKSGEPQSALDCVAGSDLIFAKHRLVNQQAMALGNAGAALTELRQFDEALEYYQRSAALFKDAGNTDMRGYVMREISSLQMKRGKQVESLFAMDAALQSRQKLSWQESLLKKLIKIVHRGMKTG
ncbi:MAG: tetratricopeptide repeat protein [Bellilinea sp.]